MECHTSQVQFRTREQEITSIATPIAFMIWSKILVLSTSNDLHCTRHLYIRQAATGMPPEKPRSWEMHFKRRSWYSYTHIEQCYRKNSENEYRAFIVFFDELCINCLPAASPFEICAAFLQLQTPRDYLWYDPEWNKIWLSTLLVLPQVLKLYLCQTTSSSYRGHHLSIMHSPILWSSL